MGTAFNPIDLSITRLIADTIPQVYEASGGLHPVRIPVEEGDQKTFSVIPLSEPLRNYIVACGEIWRDLKPLTDGSVTQIIERDWIQQKFAVQWLEMKTGLRSWNYIIDYFRRLSRRTIENQIVPKTVVIEPEELPASAVRLSDPFYSKVFDWLGTTKHTYFLVDPFLRIRSLEAISFEEVSEKENYRFYPDFLHPVISALTNPKSVVVHASRAGDLLIADGTGVIASKRKDHWTIYDNEHITASVAEVLNTNIGQEIQGEDPVCVACSIFQILFDISFKRQGGLLVIDRAENLSRYVVTGIAREAGSPLASIFTHAPFNGLEFSVPEVRKLVELSSVDGALILNPRGELMQVGSMITPHSNVRNAFGARHAAAWSAAKHGATAMKVSADGEIAIFYKQPAVTGEEVIELDFY